MKRAQNSLSRSRIDIPVEVDLDEEAEISKATRLRGKNVWNLSRSGHRR